MHYDTIFIVSASDNDEAESKVEDFLSGEDGRTNDYAEIKEILTLKEVINQVNGIETELRIEITKKERDMKKEDGTTDYTLMSEVADYHRGVFFVCAPFYNVTEYDYSVPDDIKGFWAVTVDQHY